MFTWIRRVLGDYFCTLTPHSHSGTLLSSSVGLPSVGSPMSMTGKLSRHSWPILIACIKSHLLKNRYNVFCCTDGRLHHGTRLPVRTPPALSFLRVATDCDSLYPCLAVSLSRFLAFSPTPPPSLCQRASHRNDPMELSLDDLVKLNKDAKRRAVKDQEKKSAAAKKKKLAAALKKVCLHAHAPWPPLLSHAEHREIPHAVK